MRSIAVAVAVVSVALGSVLAVVGGAAADGAAEIKAARQAVARTLKDPASARFQDVTAGRGAVCGMVNARNGLGGYAGAMAFVYVSAERAVYVLDPSSQAGPTWAAKAAAAYQRHCLG